jgi:hypothetical protein
MTGHYCGPGRPENEVVTERVEEQKRIALAFGDGYARTYGKRKISLRLCPWVEELGGRVYAQATLDSLDGNFDHPFQRRQWFVLVGIIREAVTCP